MENILSISGCPFPPEKSACDSAPGVSSNWRRGGVAQVFTLPPSFCLLSKGCLPPPASVLYPRGRDRHHIVSIIFLFAYSHLLHPFNPSFTCWGTVTCFSSLYSNNVNYSAWANERINASPSTILRMLVIIMKGLQRFLGGMEFVGVCVGEIYLFYYILSKKPPREDLQLGFLGSNITCYFYWSRDTQTTPPCAACYFCSSRWRVVNRRRDVAILFIPRLLGLLTPENGRS